ncbi:MAG: outer membrane lipoprotein-sorting protein [Trueperaceae bacterium]
MPIDRTRHLLAALATAIVLFAGTASAQQYATAEALMAAVEARPEPATTQATLRMTIATASGQSLMREMRMWSTGDTHRVIKFTAPADIAGSGFLSIDSASGDETLIYLPALDRVRRIAGGQKGDAFFGSDFAYEDISGVDPDDYTHTLLETRDAGDAGGDAGQGWVYVVEAMPTPESASSYERLVLEVPEATLVPERVTYYRDGEVVKVLTVASVVEVGEYSVAAERRMESLAGGEVVTFTTIEQTDVILDEPIPDDVFGERFLRR